MILGCTPTVIRQGTNQATRFWVMETLKEWWGPEAPNKAIVGLFGATAGATSVFANTPIDVVKTRMQVTIYLFKNYSDLYYI